MSFKRILLSRVKIQNSPLKAYNLIFGLPPFPPLSPPSSPPSQCFKFQMIFPSYSHGEFFFYYTPLSSSPPFLPSSPLPPLPPLPSSPSPPSSPFLPPFLLSLPYPGGYMIQWGGGHTPLRIYIHP